MFKSTTEMNEEGLNYLLRELCTCLVKQQGGDETDVAKLKAKAFEILLSKTTFQPVEKITSSNACRALLLESFLTNINYTNESEECTKMEEVQRLYDKICNDSYFVDGPGQSVIHFLLMQSKVDVKKQLVAKKKKYLMCPVPFSMQSQSPENPEIIALGPNSYENKMCKVKNRMGDYLPNYVVSGKIKKLQKLKEYYNCSKYNSKYSRPINCFTKLTQDIWGDKMRIGIGDYKLFSPVFSRNTPIKFAEIDSKSMIPAFEDKVPKRKEKFVRTYNWEYLGQSSIPAPKPFASESNFILALKKRAHDFQKLSFEIKIVSRPIFLRDLKLLTVGMNSDIFYEDSNGDFIMEPNISVDGVLPSTIQSYIADFLECGGCYRGLSKMMEKTDHGLKCPGIIFTALAQSVNEYLDLFRQFIYGHKDEYMMEYFVRTNYMMRQLLTIANILGAHPHGCPTITTLNGAGMLRYLYQQLLTATDNGILALLISFLRNCCNIYYWALHRWIFYGEITSSDLFIKYSKQYYPNTKVYYDRAFHIDREAVPDFLEEFQDDILLCGKYVQLLNKFKNHHPLFGLSYPCLKAYFTKKDIDNLEVQWNEYRKLAIEKCGKAISIRSTFEKRAEEKRKCHELVLRTSKENAEKWAMEKREQDIIAFKKKQELHKELYGQLELAREQKQLNCRLNVERELKWLRDIERLDDDRLIYDNINLQKRLEYYQDKSNILRDLYAAELNTKTRSTHTKSLSSRSLATDSQNSGNTEFHSCSDDDDTSNYLECFSNVVSYKNTEEELLAIIEQKRVELIERQRSKTPDRIENNNDDNNSEDDNYRLKRSISDVINSNDTIPIPIEISEMEKNREKAMSGSNVAFCIKNIPRYPSKSENTLAHKLQVLMDADSQSQSLYRDHNSNSFDGIRSERINSNINNFIIAPRQTRSNLKLHFTSELERNRQRVLDSEYNIITGEHNAIPTVKCVEDLTPMSTTSDSAIVDIYTDTGNEHRSDIENGNSTDAILREIENKLKQPKKKKQLAQEEVLEQPEQATPEQDERLEQAQLPEQVNIAKSLTENECIEIDKEKIDKEKIDNLKLLDRPEQMPHSYAAINKVKVHRSEYQHSIELIKSNFKCPPKTNLFTLNKPPYLNENILNAKKAAKELSINCISYVTIHEYIRESITIPVNAHLEILRNEVMRMFVIDLNIIDHFHSLYYYFCMMDGEFSTNMCDGIIRQLELGSSPEALLNFQLLHTILETALRASMRANKQHENNLSFIIRNLPCKFDLKSPNVLDCVSLSYKVDWPLSLILTPQAMDQYGNIFKYLIKVRRISWVLERSVQILKDQTKKHGQDLMLSPQYRHIQLIRHKLYHFVSALQSHITSNAIQASWKKFKDELMDVNVIEDIYRKHVSYLKRMLFLCLQNRSSYEYAKTVEGIFKISLNFYHNLMKCDFTKLPGNAFYTHELYLSMVSDEKDFDKFLKYTIYLGHKIVRHGYQNELKYFITLINYAHYYCDEEP